MSETARIIGIGFVGGMMSLVIKRHRPELALLVAAAASVVILFETTEAAGSIVSDLRTLTEECGVDTRYFQIALKAVGIAYITQFASELLRDSGEGAIASKVETAGKLSVLALALPVMTAFIRLCVRVVNGI